MIMILTYYDPPFVSNEEDYGIAEIIREFYKQC